ESDRGARDPPVRERDAVAGVFPPLLLQALRRPGLVLDVAVTVGVAVLIDPREGGHRVLAELVDAAFVVCEPPILREQDEPERRCVAGAVVRAVRLQPERRELAEAKLVWDLAGLLVLEVVHLFPLKLGKCVERAAYELRPHPERLIARDDRVAPEDGHEPR